jgi:FMN phosphatase YigB (HAD superfamily)
LQALAESNGVLWREPLATAAAERALCVDDTLANVASARGLGIRSHVFVDADQLRSFLQEAGVLHASARFPFVEP